MTSLSGAGLHHSETSRRRWLAKRRKDVCRGDCARPRWTRDVISKRGEDTMWCRTLWSAVVAGLVALPATGASAQEIFGAKFTHQLTPPEFCTTNKSRMCSWVEREAQGNAGHETAPRD